MTDDTWWAFIAGIDKQQLLRELPGSPDDRRMREQHAAHATRLRAAAAIPSPVADEMALERRMELVAASRRWRANQVRNRQRGNARTGDAA
ncbi:hypothetical protein [Curtobacterium sp. MCBD17_021]|uniref:hypothetical protein n=1 Tax=Curtobacterium sp. MCBD17_021 TaxID=2175665 RepID=UPI000DA8FC2D|nr:hypothetical protein [Curtobacterium sp. MCBD17_021]PZE66922.1 hypothetical protein DEI83_06330 [Curtobacterium sp. MCBD17_021]